MTMVGKTPVFACGDVAPSNLGGTLVLAGIMLALVIGRALSRRRDAHYDDYRARHERPARARVGVALAHAPPLGNGCRCPPGVPCPCACHEVHVAG